jgi:predicted site-specific integrase-resolvase
MSEFRKTSERLCELHSIQHTLLIAVVGELAYKTRLRAMGGELHERNAAIHELAGWFGNKAEKQGLPEDLVQDIKTVLRSFVTADAAQGINEWWEGGVLLARS